MFMKQQREPDEDEGRNEDEESLRQVQQKSLELFQEEYEELHRMFLMADQEIHEIAHRELSNNALKNNISMNVQVAWEEKQSQEMKELFLLELQTRQLLVREFDELANLAEVPDYCVHEIANQVIPEDLKTRKKIDYMNNRFTRNKYLDDDGITQVVWFDVLAFSSIYQLVKYQEQNFFSAADSKWFQDTFCNSFTFALRFPINSSPLSRKIMQTLNIQSHLLQPTLLKDVPSKDRICQRIDWMKECLVLRKKKKQLVDEIYRALLEFDNESSFSVLQIKSRLRDGGNGHKVQSNWKRNNEVSSSSIRSEIKVILVIPLCIKFSYQVSEPSFHISLIGLLIGTCALCFWFRLSHQLKTGYVKSEVVFCERNVR